jgi:hypothetical protein
MLALGHLKTHTYTPAPANRKDPISASVRSNQSIWRRMCGPWRGCCRRRRRGRCCRRRRRRPARPPPRRPPPRTACSPSSPSRPSPPRGTRQVRLALVPHPCILTSVRFPTAKDKPRGRRLETTRAIQSKSFRFTQQIWPEMANQRRRTEPARPRETERLGGSGTGGYLILLAGREERHQTPRQRWNSLWGSGSLHSAAEAGRRTSRSRLRLDQGGRVG